MAGRNLQEILEHLRAKPDHHRKRIAMGTSIGVTAVIALGWVVAMGTTGGFSLKTTEVAADTATPSTDVQSAIASTKSNFSQLLGAAGAAIGATSSPASLNIVETRASSTLDTKPQNATDATSISF